MTIIETERLTLRELAAEDAQFILELVNDPAWLRHIGDKRTHAGRRACLHRERTDGES